MTDTERFFALLYRDAPKDSRVTLWTLPGGDSEHLPPDPSILEARAAELAPTHDVYFGVLPRREGLTRRQRGGKVDLLDGSALWLDVDVGKEGHAAKNLPPDLESALLLLADAELPDPSIVVFSGYGYHFYWKLDAVHQPVQIEVACKALQTRVIKAGLARGWHVDQTGNADRVLRVPDTFNHKKLAA